MSLPQRKSIIDIEDRVARTLCDTGSKNITLATLGLTEEEFTEIAGRPEFQERFKRIIISSKLLPVLPELIGKIAAKVLERPNTQWTKLALELAGLLRVGKEGDKSITLVNANPDALRRDVRKIMELANVELGIGIKELEEVVSRGA
jgi:hypothetical protein